MGIHSLPRMVIPSIFCTMCGNPGVQHHRLSPASPGSGDRRHVCPDAPPKGDTRQPHHERHGNPGGGGRSLEVSRRWTPTHAYGSSLINSYNPNSPAGPVQTVTSTEEEPNFVGVFLSFISINVCYLVRQPCF